MNTVGFASSGQAQLHYESVGDGPPVLFLHAGVADSRMWQQQRDMSGLRMICFDQRGFGRTEMVAEPYATRADAITVLDHLKVPEAVIVGCSSGGEAALQLAITAPQRVSGLILVGTTPSGWESQTDSPDDPDWAEIVAAFRAGDLLRTARLEARHWLAGRERALHDLDSQLVELFIEMDLIALGSETERNKWGQALEQPTNDQLDKVNARTLVIVGEHDIPACREAAPYLAGRLNAPEAVVMANTAHLPSMDQPQEFNELIVGFLA
jgi:3-oxoadipate enol-lactonase